jgi:hypothetical protein
MAAPPAAKLTKRGQNRPGKATETEQFIVALPSYPAVEDPAKASAKPTERGDDRFHMPRDSNLLSAFYQFPL